MKEERSQLVWLNHDADLIHSIVQTNPQIFEAAGDLTDLTRQNHVVTVADLLYRALDAALGLGAVLTHGLRAPSFALGRMLMEAVTNIVHMQAMTSPAVAALDLRAYSLLRWCEFFPENEVGVNEWRSILQRMPAESVARAESRVKSKQSWSGLTMKHMMAHYGIGPYTAYQLMSAEAHGGMVGNHAVVQRDTEMTGRLKVGSPMLSEEVETSANFGRRMLHVGFKCAWGALGGKPVNLNTTDPNEWAEKHRNANPAA